MLTHAKMQKKTMRQEIPSAMPKKSGKKSATI
jgi:hypothetical protein